MKMLLVMLESNKWLDCLIKLDYNDLVWCIEMLMPLII